MNARFLRSRGFTLIEMLITLSVFMLLAGAIFSIVGATLESASVLQGNQDREDTSAALENWVRHSLLTLPADGVVVPYNRNERSAGIIWGADNDLQALDLQSQPNGNFLLRLASYGADPAETPSSLTGSALTSSALAKFQAEISSDNPVLKWRPLVRDLKSVSWRFRATVGADWSDTLPMGRPLIAELTFLRAGESSAIAADFWIPLLQPASNPALPAAAPALSVNP